VRRRSITPDRVITSDASLTWDDLVRIEPLLARLYRNIRAIKDDKHEPAFCANAAWYGHGGRPINFKEQMQHLVGWHAQDPRLRAQQANRLAYVKLYDALPNCRNCNCA
jgi:hypothetical protein